MTRGYFESSYLDTPTQYNPINLNRSGHYQYYSGTIEEKRSVARYWQSMAHDNQQSAYYLRFWSTTLELHSQHNKGNGSVLRCLVPLVGWQLPTYNGTKSYQNLLVGVYGMINSTTLNSSHLDTAVQNNPINFIRSGFYYYGSGGIGARSSDGDYWQAKADDVINARLLIFFSTYLYSWYYNNAKGYGFQLRCLAR